MSANLYWRPTQNDGNSVPTSCPSRTMESLKELGFNLDSSHLPALRALRKQNDGNEAWDVLIDAIEKHDHINWYAEW